MELWQLRYFVQVAEAGSLAKASSVLNVAAPAVSRSIKSLEEELEARLFDRDGRGMHLTEAGRTLLARATSMLRDAEIAKQEVSASGSRPYGDVTVGMTPSVAVMIGKSLIDVVRQKYPDIRLRLLESYSGYLIDWVRTGSLGLALVNGLPPDEPRIVSKPLAVERLFAVGRAGRFLDQDTAISFKDLTRHPLLLPSNLHSTRELIDDIAARLGVTIMTEVETDSVVVFKGLVMDGMADGILPFGAVRQEVDAGQLSAVPVTDPEIHSEIQAVHAMDAPLSSASRAVLSEIETLFTQAIAADSHSVFVKPELPQR